MGFEKLNLTQSTPHERWAFGVTYTYKKEAPGQIWTAAGIIEGQKLEVRQLRETELHHLAKELATVSPLVATGLNCPFSLPLEFIEYIAEHTTDKSGSIQSWQEIVESIVFMPLENLLALATDFKKEPKRFTDTAAKIILASPLHRLKPPLLPTTYQTMRFLASLDPKNYYVLPFQDPLPTGCAVLEIYPAGILAHLGLSGDNYKSNEKKDHDRMQSIRHKLLQQLLNLKSANTRFKDLPQLVLNKKIEHLAVDSGEALDAVISCYGTALSVYEPQLFADPLESNNLDVLLEGWAYEPSKL